MRQSSNFILRILKAARFRDWARRQFRDPPRNTGSLEPGKVKKPLQAECWDRDGFGLLTITPPQPQGQHLIYLPGGAYLLEATPFHRGFVEKLVKLTGFSATIIDYPKAPEHTYQTTHQLLGTVYQSLRERYPEASFILAGDSAGGGLALAFLQSLRDQGITPLPAKTVLLSPWLDLSLSHPQIPGYEERDLILPLDGLAEAAHLYSGGEDLKNPTLSPLYGNLEGLGEILLIFSSEELFFPDCQTLIDKAQSAPETEITPLLGENQVHTWPVFPFPESKSAVDRIATFMT